MTADPIAVADVVLDAALAADAQAIVIEPAQTIGRHPIVVSRARSRSITTCSSAPCGRASSITTSSLPSRVSGSTFSAALARAPSSRRNFQG